MEVYKRVYIKTADDLPKEVGYYFVKFKQKNDPNIYTDTFASHYFGEGDIRDAVWNDCIDWWLEPVEIPTKDDANDFAAKIDISGSEYRGFQKCYNWLLSRLK